MAAKGLEEDFLDDLDDLGSDESGDEAVEVPEASGQPRVAPGDPVKAQVAALAEGAKRLEGVALLRRSRSYREHMERVEAALAAPPSAASSDAGLAVLCHDVIASIDEEVAKVFAFVTSGYSVKFPELAKLVPNTVDYARTVKIIGNEMDLTQVDLSGTLPSATVMVVSVTGSTTAGRPLAPDALEQVLLGCGELLALATDRQRLVRLVETQLLHLAPNVCAICGAQTAARLVALAGGLTALSRVPSCNLTNLGQERTEERAGFGNAALQRHVGVLAECELVQSVPPYLRGKALKITAAKVVLAARTDAFQGDPSGTMGRQLRAGIEERMEKLQEPSQGSRTKALPKPDPVVKKRRGGKRVRRAKERFKVTELAKEANRSSFASMDTAEYGEDAMGLGFGQLGSRGGGRLRGAQPITKTKNLGMKRQRQASAGGQASKERNSGISSSLVFTPVQGLELVDPTAEAKRRVAAANAKWFNDKGGFLSAKPK